MPEFSDTSNRRLDTCDARLQTLFREIVRTDDCAVIEGHRNMRTQNDLFAQGKSKVRWPDSKHNDMPARAVDVAPCVHGRVSWDKNQCYHFGGIVKEKARRLGIGIRWGGDWDGDGDLNDQTFNDLVHFELTELVRLAEPDLPPAAA